VGVLGFVFFFVFFFFGLCFGWVGGFFLVVCVFVGLVWGSTAEEEL